MIELFLKYWSFFAFLLNGAAAIFITFIGQKMNNVLRKFEEDEIEPLKRDVAKLQGELSLVRHNLQYFPTSKDLNDLLLQIVELRGDHKALNASIKAISDGQQANTAALIRLEGRLAMGMEQ